jgi:hypothetical protein
MKLSLAPLLCFFLLTGSRLLAQSDGPTFPVAGFSMIGKMKFNLGDMMGQPFSANTYSGVKGSPYLIDSFMAAAITLNNGKTYQVDHLRLNLYTNQVHFLTPDGRELVAGDGVVKRIFFFLTPDSSHPVVYSSGYPPASGVTPFVFMEELNSGDYALLRLTSRTIINDVGTSNSPMGQHFSDQSVYYLVNRKMNELVKWKKGVEYLEKALPSEASRIAKYTADHHLSCKNAGEVAEVLQYVSTK